LNNNIIFVDEGSTSKGMGHTVRANLLWLFSISFCIPAFFFLFKLIENSHDTLSFYLYIIFTFCNCINWLFRICYNCKNKYKNNYRFILLKKPWQVIVSAILPCIIYSWISTGQVILISNWENNYTIVVVIIQYLCALMSMIITIWYIIYLKRHPERKNRKYISWEEYKKRTQKLSRDK
jgi:hypothetical protein